MLAIHASRRGSNPSAPRTRGARSTRRTNRRLPIHAATEALETRELLSTIALTSPGPISRITLGDDTGFQVQLNQAGNTTGQMYPGDSLPGDAGLFLREADGTVVGLNVLSSAQSQRTKAGDTQSRGLRPLYFAQTALPGALQTLLVADNAGDQNRAGNHFLVAQVVTYWPGEWSFRVDTTILNQAAQPLTLDAFLAADLYLNDNDRGVGYFNAKSGAVGGVSLLGTSHGFIQPNPNGGLNATAYQTGDYASIWRSIGSGGNLDEDVNLPVGGSPYGGDPAAVDNGTGLQWQGLSIGPGALTRVSAFWSFGKSSSVPLEQPPSALAQSFSARAGQSSTPVLATANLPPGADAGLYQAMILWGDGSIPEYGVLRRAGSGYEVLGTHQYGSPGTYPVFITVVGPGGGATIVGATAQVSGQPAPTIQGRLAASSDTGVSASDGITRDNTPSFQGQGTPGATVQLTAQRQGSSASPINLGTTTINSAGSWSINSGRLADGSYVVTAAARIGTNSPTTVTLFSANRPLVVDTQAPSVTGLQASIRNGKIVLTVIDTGGAGLDVSTNPALPTARLMVSTAAGNRSLSIRPTRDSASSPAQARFVIQTSPALKLGRLFALRLAIPLRDRAGNELDGSYRSSFPTGGGSQGAPLGILVRTNGSRILGIRSWNGSTASFNAAKR